MSAHSGGPCSYLSTPRSPTHTPVTDGITHVTHCLTHTSPQTPTAQTSRVYNGLLLHLCILSLTSEPLAFLWWNKDNGSHFSILCVFVEGEAGLGWESKESGACCRVDSQRSSLFLSIPLNQEHRCPVGLGMYFHFCYGKCSRKEIIGRTWFLSYLFQNCSLVNVHFWDQLRNRLRAGSQTCSSWGNF